MSGWKKIGLGSGVGCSTVVLVIILWISPLVLSRPHSRQQVESSSSSSSSSISNNNANNIITFRGLNTPIFFEEPETQASDTMIQFAFSESKPRGSSSSSSSSNSESLIFPNEEDSEDDSPPLRTPRPTSSKTDTISYAVDDPKKQAAAQSIILHPDHLVPGKQSTTRPSTTGTRFAGAAVSDPKITHNNKPAKNKNRISSQEIQILDEKLGKFVTWVQTKGLPDNFVEATSPSLPIDETKLDEYHLSKGGTLECPENQKRGPGGVCLEVTDFM